MPGKPVTLADLSDYEFFMNVSATQSLEINRPDEIDYHGIEDVGENHSLDIFKKGEGFVATLTDCEADDDTTLIRRVLDVLNKQPDHA